MKKERIEKTELIQIVKANIEMLASLASTLLEPSVLEGLADSLYVRYERECDKIDELQKEIDRQTEIFE